PATNKNGALGAVMTATVRGAVPGLETVISAAVELLPTRISPKSTGSGERATRGSTPIPVRVTVFVGLPPATEATVTTWAAVPTSVGEQRRCTVQLPAGATANGMAPQLPPAITAKGAATPISSSTFRGVVPGFEMLSPWIGESLPTSTSPKSSGSGESDSSG